MSKLVFDAIHEHTNSQVLAILVKICEREETKMIRSKPNNKNPDNPHHWSDSCKYPIWSYFPTPSVCQGSTKSIQFSRWYTQKCLL